MTCKRRKFRKSCFALWKPPAGYIDRGDTFIFIRFVRAKTIGHTVVVQLNAPQTHTETRDRPVWTVWKHLSSWCIVCDCYLSRNIRSSDSFFLADFHGKSGKFKKKIPAFGKLRVPESFYILMYWEIKISRYIIRSAMKKICSLASVIFSDGIFLAIQYRKFYFLHS